MKKLFFVFTFLVVMAHAEIIDRILVVVNSEIVLASDLRKFQHQLKSNQTFDDSLGLSYENVKKDQKLQIEYLVLQKIIESEIKRLNLSVTSERIDQELRDIARRNKITVNDVYASVRNEGLSISEYQEFIKSKIERQNLFSAEIISKLKVSEEEVRVEYAKKHKVGSNDIFEFSLAHIFFNPKKGGDAQAIKRAQVALEKLKLGTNFEEVAEQFSEDPNFSNGGFLGVFKTGESIKELEDAVAKLNAGETSGVVKTKVGYHILKVNEKKTISDPQYDRQKEAIRAQILEGYFQKQMKIWLQSKKDEAFIRYN